jgi:hypothetical protein
MLLPRLSSDCQSLARQLVARWRGLPSHYEIPRINPVSLLAFSDVRWRRLTRIAFFRRLVEYGLYSPPMRHIAHSRTKKSLWNLDGKKNRGPSSLRWHPSYNQANRCGRRFE